MINFTKYKTILWDFDGVLMDSMPVRDKGFEMVLSSYPKNEIAMLLTFHRQNGGLSRYVKFRYFFEEIRKQSISMGEIENLAERFSSVMRKELVNKNLLLQDSVQFVKANYQRYGMHIVSGSDEKELQYLAKELNLGEYFISIHGSPTPKKQLVAELLAKFEYNLKDLVFIGDSKNDWEAASSQSIDFVGYNNPELIGMGIGYIDFYKNVNS